MAEKKINTERKGRRHRKSEINMALFLFQASYQGNYQDLQEVLFSDKIKNEKKFLVLNARAADGMPILINCLRGSAQVNEEKDYLECIKVLVSTGIPLDTNDANGKTAIHWAVLLDKLEICSYLLQQGATVESSKISPLHIAISKRAHKFVKLLCEYKVNKEMLEEKDDLGRTPLCHALLIDNGVYVFEELLLGGCNINGKMVNEKTLISHIIENSMSEHLALALKYDVNLFPNGRNRLNFIHMSAIQKEPSIIRVLAENCSITDLDALDQNGKTPLMHAVENGLVENISAILSREVNVKLKDNDGNTALHFTNRNTTKEIVDMLILRDASLLNIPNKMKRFPIHSAVLSSNQEIVRALLDHGADFNVIDSEGHTLIHYAAEFSSAACLAELGSVGLSLNIPDNHGVYPIHYAVRLEQNEVGNINSKILFLKKLVSMGVNLSVIDDRGLQPIHWAVCMGFVEALKVLLIEDANVKAVTNKECYSALHLACNNVQFECLDLLVVQPTIDIGQVDAHGRTALFSACNLKDHRFTESLLQAGANPDHQDIEGKTPAHIAATNMTGDCLWLLSLKRANFEIKNAKGETPIHMACKNAEEACLRFLLSRRCNVNAVLNNGMSVLHIAVSSKCSNKVNLLLQNGAKWNQIYHGESEPLTPLDVALENADHKCIKLLQSYGARTAHYILTQAANVIRTTWKNYRKRKVARGEASPLANSSSIYTSSNASESVSTKGAYREEETQRHHRTDRDESVSANESSEIVTLQGQSVTSWSVKEFQTEVHVQPCLGGVEIPEYMLRVLTEDYRREFNDRIKRSDAEIMLMRELMKETETLLTRAKRVNQEAESIANSQAFRNIKTANKQFRDDKRRMINNSY